MHASQVRRFGQAAVRDAPPHWAVVTVRCCVVGLLALPVLMPVALAATTGVGALEPFRPVAFGLSIVVWLGLFACAQLITTTYPPVPSR
ncbi:MAG TPA: hypothetical protein VMU15_06970 [Anaeromyxobacter sp.]|nr:hypothetical protein [Anaeromyxobacter sp.]